MKRRWREILDLLFLGLLVGAGSGRESGTSVVTLNWGVNSLDLDGDGTADLAIKARWHNGNAHDFSNYTFYRRDEDSEYGVWEVVPFELDRGKPLEIGIASIEGADCIVQNVRFLRNARGAMEIVLATREWELGDTYLDVRPVKFRWFEIKHNSEGIVGWTPVYFAEKRSQASKAPYCDVNEALKKELGL